MAEQFAPKPLKKNKKKQTKPLLIPRSSGVESIFMALFLN